MTARAGCGLVVALMLATSSACEIIRPLDLHPDVVALSVLLVAGESEARMLAIHPYRERGGAAPEITASLVGPGWMAAFSDTLELEACTLAEEWPGPVRCLGAVLPEAIQPQGEYGLRGTAPLGSFAGRTRVPTPPLLWDPADSLQLRLPREPGWMPIPVWYYAHVDAGTRLVDVLDVFEFQEDGTETTIPADSLGYFPLRVDRTRASTVVGIYQNGKPIRFSLRLLGLGWNYTNFVKLRHSTDPLPSPWPNFGIEGEGAFGYFDGVAASRTARVFVR